MLCKEKIVKLNFQLDFMPYILVAMVWCHTILLQYVRAVIMRLPVIGQFPDFILALMYAFAIAYTIREFRLTGADVSFLLIIPAIAILSPILYPSTLPYWREEVGRFLLVAVPAYFVGVILVRQTDSEKMLNLMYVLSCITIVAKLLYSVVFAGAMSAEVSQYKGDMDGAYKLLPHLCLVFYYVLKKKNLLNMVLFASGSVFMLFLGSRGPVLIEVLCVAALILLFAQWKHKKIKITVFAVLFVAFISSPLFFKTVELLSEIAGKAGLSVRIFDKLLNHGIMYDSGRSELADTLYQALRIRPFWGYGLYGDRQFIGIYAHKLYLELWFHFGYVFGTVIFASILITPIAAYRAAGSQEKKALIVILYFVGVVKLFLSGSYLHEQMLFLLLGISLSVLRERMRKRQNADCRD